MIYKKMLFSYWLKKRLKESFLLIPSTAAIALLAWFFTNVVGNHHLTYLVVWRWSYIICFGILFLDSFRNLWFRWKVDHFLSNQWHTTPEAIFDADVNLNMFGNAKFEEVKTMFDRKDFLTEYRAKKNIHNLVSKVLK